MALDLAPVKEGLQDSPHTPVCCPVADDQRRLTTHWNERLESLTPAEQFGVRQNEPVGLPAQQEGKRADHRDRSTPAIQSRHHFGRKKRRGSIAKPLDGA